MILLFASTLPLDSLYFSGCWGTPLLANHLNLVDEVGITLIAAQNIQLGLLSVPLFERVDLSGQLGDLVGHVPIRGLEVLVQALDLELPLLVVVGIGLLEVGELLLGIGVLHLTGHE